ncbi:DUF5107 domain-containing protein [Auraticoccus monumenti]|uniref:DUF5107 domain-containing protein n=1 Tax=Auraticoccus monumenti TaxID=675864 RepID=A0A1G6T0Q9_9ACTN|nr:DUF5107 domain-containing protein [Auraticoccus monumenti]SDD22474.1 hypothetical protein SAMN04489747_0485 [Auraticoccus monumenti]
MSELRQELLEIPCAGLGPENPLPDLGGHGDLHRVRNAEDLPVGMRRGIGHGHLRSILPCLFQDGYDRDRRPVRLPVLVLENEHLTATVLPTLGGRLHSLVQRATGRELLHRNAVIQPGNLGLRGAWFAGGVEWNLGSTGHWTGTCEPVHAAALTGPDGSPVLRLWEWERTRGLVSQLDLWLPGGSDLLHVSVRVTNPAEQPAPAYWWSNAAVPQTPATRVLVPADQAWRYGYTERLELVDVPGGDEVSDLTRPMAHRRAVDYFFELPAEDLPDTAARARERPFVAAVEPDGTGILHASTCRLRGRKLFVWGEGRGGRRWQEWLTPDGTGHGYAEIQAGLARTQMEHLELPGRSAWSWLEVYGAAALDPEDAAAEWPRARRAVADHLDQRLPEEEMDRRAGQLAALADVVPERVLHTASGWGALELARTGSTVSEGTPFAMTGAHTRERAWLPLLEGRLPDTDPLTAPDGTLVQWGDLLEAADGGWLVRYHRGVARWWRGDEAGAVTAWRESLEHRPSPWVWRNLAVAAGRSGDPAGLVEGYQQALTLAPGLRPLAVEALTELLETGRAGVARELLEQLPAELRRDDRVLLVEVRLRLATGEASTAERLLDAGIAPVDLREGSVRLADLWQAVQQALGQDRPVPARYDFSMTGG